MRAETKQTVTLVLVIVLVGTTGLFVYLTAESFSLKMNAEGSMTVTITAQVLFLSLGSFVGVNSLRSAADYETESFKIVTDGYEMYRKQFEAVERRLQNPRDPTEEDKEALADAKRILHVVAELEAVLKEARWISVRRRSDLLSNLRFNLLLGLLGILWALFGIAFTLQTWAAPLFASEALVFFLGHLSAFVVLVLTGLGMMGGTLSATLTPGPAADGVPGVPNT